MAFSQELDKTEFQAIACWMLQRCLNKVQCSERFQPSQEHNVVLGWGRASQPSMLGSYLAAGRQGLGVERLILAELLILFGRSQCIDQRFNDIFLLKDWLQEKYKKIPASHFFRRKKMKRLIFFQLRLQGNLHAQEFIR